MKNKVTVVLPTYNSRQFLDQCLPPLLEMDYPDYDIVVIDDCSSDGTIEYLQQNYPQTRIIQLEQHSGHCKACNTGILATEARYVYIVEHHTIVTKEALSQLMKVMLTKDAAICYSKQINIYQENFAVVEGKRFAHYVVNQHCKRMPLGESPHEEDNEVPVDVTSAGTFSFLLDKAQFEKIGLFDEDYFIHINDYELALRVKAAGLKCYYVPTSLSYHKSFVSTASSYNFRGGREYPASRAFFIAKNRWLLMLSYYDLKTLILLGPALALYEMALIIFMIYRRVFGSYVKAISWLLTHQKLILKKRRKIQQLKEVTDRRLLSAGELNFVPGLTQSALGKITIQVLTKSLTWYWNVFQRFLPDNR